MCKRKRITQALIQIVVVVPLLILLSPLTVTAGVPFQSGNIFLGDGNSNIYQYSSGGHSLEGLDIGAGVGHTVMGVCFSTNGNYLYATSSSNSNGRISQFNNQGTLLHSVWGSINFPQFYPVSCVVDVFGNVYVGAVPRAGITLSPKIMKIDPDGNILTNFTLEPDESSSYQSIDLGRNQCTLIYTAGGKIKRFDVCSNSQLPDFSDLSDLPPGNRICSAVRIRNNGEVMAVCDAPNNRSDIIRLQSNGQIIGGYEASSYQDCSSTSCAPFASVNFSPDGSLWATIKQHGTIPARFVKINIDSGEKITSFDVTSVGPVAIYREPRAATTECGDGIDNDNDGLIDYPNDDLCFAPQDNSESMICRTVLGRIYCYDPKIERIIYLIAIIAVIGIGWSLWRKRRK